MVGTRAGDLWRIDVQGVGTSSVADLGAIEAGARSVLREHGIEDADTVDLQLLLPDFEVDLAQQGVPSRRLGPVELVSSVIALVVVIGAIAFVVGRAFG